MGSSHIFPLVKIFPFGGTLRIPKRRKKGDTDGILLKFSKIENFPVGGVWKIVGTRYWFARRRRIKPSRHVRR